MEHNKIVSREEWLKARKALLLREKEQTRLRDALSAERRALPWVRVEKDYVFDAPDGARSLSDLFDGRSQLIVKHFMFGPGWKEGCVGCSFEVDHIEGALQHILHHDVTVVAVARAPLEEITAFKKRMGWSIPWMSSQNNSFNYDYHVSATPEDLARGSTYYNYRDGPIPIEEQSGLSVFLKDGGGRIFHTYSAYGRGAEEVMSSYMLLDLTPKGRNETGRGDLTDWVRHHDRYGTGGTVEATGRASADDACCHDKSKAL